MSSGIFRGRPYPRKVEDEIARREAARTQVEGRAACRTCHGWGWHVATSSRAGGVHVQDCDTCAGTGHRITPRQRAILRLLRRQPNGEELTANQIAYALGFENAPSKGGPGAGRGGGAGTGPAQRVIGSLNGLKGRGLVYGGVEGFGAV